MSHESELSLMLPTYNNNRVANKRIHSVHATVKKILQIKIIIIDYEIVNYAQKMCVQL